MDVERYAIVIPFYDGLDTIQALVCRIANVFSKLPYDYQVILVDDSADETKKRALHEWFGAEEKVRLITLPENHGQHYATIQGFKAAAGCGVITLDEDLQHCPEDIPVLLEERLAKQFDVVYGNRKQRDWRYWAGRLIFTICFPKGPMTTSSFRIVNPEMVRKLSKLNPRFYEVEGMIYQLRPKYGYADIQVERTGRRNNRSSYSLIRMFFLIINLIAYYSSFPIILVCVLCLLIQLLLFAFTGTRALIFLPISGMSVLTLIAYISTWSGEINS